jgi:two-component system, OmpR family, response regulator
MRVLVAEDEQRVAEAVSAAVATQGFVPDIASDGEEAWFRGSTENYAVIVLDLGLPKLDGMQILKRWREEKVLTPVIVLSARGTWAERVAGIDAGADDYLPKPFEMEELLARIRAVLRRNGARPETVVELGELRLDLKSGTTFRNGVPVNLTPLEFRLLQHLAANHERYVGKEELAEQLYDFNHEKEANAIEAIVSRLRRKLGVDVIENRRGFGYRLNPGSE